MKWTTKLRPHLKSPWLLNRFHDPNCTMTNRCFANEREQSCKQSWINAVVDCVLFLWQNENICCICVNHSKDSENNLLSEIRSNSKPLAPPMTKTVLDRVDMSYLLSFNKWWGVNLIASNHTQQKKDLSALCHLPPVRFDQPAKSMLLDKYGSHEHIVCHHAPQYTRFGGDFLPHLLITMVSWPCYTLTIIKCWFKRMMVPGVRQLMSLRH